MFKTEGVKWILADPLQAEISRKRDEFNMGPYGAVVPIVAASVAEK